MSTLFTGLGDIYDRLRTTPVQPSPPPQLLFIAEVVDVVMSKTHAKYKSDVDIGKIIIREYGSEIGYNKEEAAVSQEAYPLDITNLRVPLPGEFVVVMNGLPGDHMRGVNLAPTAYYISTITSLHNINYNGLPFGGTHPSRLLSDAGKLAGVNIKQLIERHKKRFVTFVERQLKQLRPYEGDVIVQGRFGNSIRLGSTVSSAGNANPYAAATDALLGEETQAINKSTWSSEGSSGDPIILMRTAKFADIEIPKNKLADIFTVEDINKDGSSFYLCQNQKVELKLQVATVGFKTWLKDMGIKPPEKKKTKDNDGQKTTTNPAVTDPATDLTTDPPVNENTFS